jgi:hypothetical protein
MGMAMAKHFAEGLGSPGVGSGHLPGGSPATAGPPPIPNGRAFYVAREGRPAGPFEIAELRQQQRDGRLTASSLVWAEGMAGWEEARTVKDLTSLFGAVPPPLPGN